MGSSFSARQRREQRLQSLVKAAQPMPQPAPISEERDSVSNNTGESSPDTQQEEIATNLKSDNSSGWDMEKPTYKRYVDSSYEEISSIKNSIKDIPNNQVKHMPQAPPSRNESEKPHQVSLRKKKSIATEKPKTSKPNPKNDTLSAASSKKIGKKKKKKIGKEKETELQKEDSFLRDFDPSNLDFSKDMELSEVMNYENSKSENLVLVENIKLDLQAQFNKHKPNFRNVDDVIISPIVSDTEEELEGTDKERQNMSIIEEKVKKYETQSYSIPFNWGEEGTVDLRTVKYWLEYNPKIKGFRIKKSDNSFLRTIISWKRNAANPKIFNFAMRDEEIINLETGQNYKLKLPNLEFKVDSHGNFLGALNTKDIAHNLINFKRKQDRATRPNQEELISEKKAWKAKIKELTHSMDSKLEITWKKLLQNWSTYLKEDSEATEDEERHLNEIQEVEHLDNHCLLLSRGDMSSREDIKEHLIQKVADPDLYQELQRSQHFISDPLSIWELKGETAKVRLARSKYQEQEFEDFLRSKYAKDLCNFYAIDKFDLDSVIIEKDTLRPHIINSQKSTRLVFDTFDGAFVQIEEEMELSIFLWPEIQTQKKQEEYYYREIGKFRKNIRALFSTILAGILRMRTAPLNFKPAGMKAFQA